MSEIFRSEYPEFCSASFLYSSINTNESIFPFKRNNELTSAGDQIFHQSLIQADPQIGYKDDAWMTTQFKEVKLELLKVVPMPANNLAFIYEKPRV